MQRTPGWLLSEDPGYQFPPGYARVTFTSRASSIIYVHISRALVEAPAYENAVSLVAGNKGRLQLQMIHYVLRLFSLHDDFESRRLNEFAPIRRK